MIGQTLGPYRIDRELGSGGMGKVYAAVVAGRCPGLDEGTHVALKVVHPHLLETPGFFKRFLREGEIGKSVRHDNVVATFDCDQLVADGVHHNFLAMEYVEGQTLRELLDELERVPEELCRHIAREVCKGLSAIHAAGVIHRDMKPDNVLITADHVVKVMDLGVARLQDEALRLSQTGAFVGSIHYAAPEAFREGGRHVDARADLHALGLVLYELACGTNPYQADTVPAILKRVLHEEPRRLGDANPQLSPFFEEVVHCLLAKLADDRFASADELLAVLEAGEDSEWWRSRARSIQATTKRPVRRIRIPRETAVYGREAELTLLRSRFEQAKVGEGQVVLIEGEAGIGKSRLVDELVTRLQQGGEDLNFLFGSYPPNGAATAAGAFSSAFREQFGEEGAGAYLPRTQLLVPAFDAVLSGDSAPTGAQPLTKESLTTCFVHATQALAAERPTVVLIDDLHFGPDEARTMFTSLATAVPGHRVLLIGTTRPVVAESWQGGLDRFEYTTRLSPQRLAAKDLVALLKDAFHSEQLAESLGLKVMVKSDGNPFFTFEIIRGLREGQFITREDDGTWVSTRVIDDIQIPSSVLELVSARVSDLTEEERDLLDVACCWGFEFDPGLIGDVLEIRRIPLLKRFGQIERRHRLVRSSGRNYVFDHHQVQEALYGTLHEQMREEYHAALAEALETRAGAADADPETLDGALCVDLCEHYLKGARGEAALRYLLPAKEHLAKGYLHAEALALVERALAVPGLLTGRERAEALLALVSGRGAPLDILGLRERQEEVAREAEQLAATAADDALRAKAALALCRVFLTTTRLSDLESAAPRALELARAAGDARSEAGVLDALGFVAHLRQQASEARDLFARSLALYREIGYQEGEAGAIVRLSGTYAREGRRGEVREHLQQAIALQREIGDRRGEARALVSLGNEARIDGRLPEARQHLERALSLPREVGDRLGECYALDILAVLAFHEGRFDVGLAHSERALALSREIGNRLREASCVVNVGVAYFHQGRLTQARERFERSREIARDVGLRMLEPLVHHNFGRIALEQGDDALAEECMARSEEVCQGSDGVADSWHVSGINHLFRGSMRAVAGETDAARSFLETARDLGVTHSVPSFETLARCELACLPGGDPVDALAAVAENELALLSQERREVRYLLWKATGDRAHLVEARRLLDEAVASVDAETRPLMRENLRISRAILAACADAGL